MYSTAVVPTTSIIPLAVALFMSMLLPMQCLTLETAATTTITPPPPLHSAKRRTACRPPMDDTVRFFYPLTAIEEPEPLIAADGSKLKASSSIQSLYDPFSCNASFTAYEELASSGFAYYFAFPRGICVSFNKIQFTVDGERDKFGRSAKLTLDRVAPGYLWTMYNDADCTAPVHSISDWTCGACHRRTSSASAWSLSIDGKNITSYQLM